MKRFNVYLKLDKFAFTVEADSPEEARRIALDRVERSRNEDLFTKKDADIDVA